jgi:AraC-like DNA-binding protein
MLHNYFKYLNVTSFEHQWGMYVTTVGYSKVEPNDQYPNQQHPESHHLTWNRGRILNDYYVVFISRGKGMYGSALTKPEEVVAGNCFLLHPGVWHRYKPDPKLGWEEHWVGFNGKFVQQLMDQEIFDPGSPIIDLGFNTEMLVLYNKLIDEVQLSSVGYPQQIAGITMQILGLISNLARHNEPANDPVGKLIAKAKFLIQESFENSLDMEQLARELPMGYSSFRKAFKRIAGQSPNQYHLNLRLDRARNLLVGTALNINEISDQIGFESVSYFSKLFKKKYGISPKGYRLTESGSGTEA